MEKKAKESEKVEGTPIQLDDRVKIRGAKKARILTPGKVKEVHPELAKKLVAKGEATYA